MATTTQANRKPQPQTRANSPVFALRSGGCEVAVFKHAPKGEQKRPSYSTRLSYSYLDQNQQWTTSEYIPERDLAGASMLMQSAWSFICRSQEKDRIAAAAGQPAEDMPF